MATKKDCVAITAMLYPKKVKSLDDFRIGDLILWETMPGLRYYGVVIDIEPSLKIMFSDEAGSVEYNAQHLKQIMKYISILARAKR